MIESILIVLGIIGCAIVGFILAKAIIYVIDKWLGIGDFKI